MFKLMKNATYWWPVIVGVPSADKPGELENAAFEVQFKRLDVDAHAALMEEVGPKQMNDRDFSKCVALEFRGVVDGDGNPVPCSPEVFDQLLAEPNAASAIAKAYFDSRKQAAEKN